ncbi:hypothetical protein QTP88_001528 [Uroleucon formosanum]
MASECDTSVVYSQQGNVLLVKSNYKFTKYTELISVEIGWKWAGTHTHESIDTNIIVPQKISNGIKRKGLDYITDRPSKLIKLEIANNVEAASTLTCKDTKLIRDSISRERLRNLPKFPKSISEYMNILITPCR